MKISAAQSPASAQHVMNAANQTKEEMEENDD